MQLNPLFMAQALYQLGKFDTFVDNGDGTTTITRQTGYVVINAEDITSTSVETAGGSGYKFVRTKYNELPVDTTIVYGRQCGFSSNNYAVNRVGAYWGADKSITMDNTSGNDNNVSIVNNDCSTVDQFKALCPIQIQYKLAEATTENVITGLSIANY